ncbi:MAG TPA: 16S rRNA (guanine(527)-N(7))-methyltransferase RsmG [Candidatus Acidoferrales bacterium]|jgi:16S rRNA (guanine527-N7)-methyltransferase|nr:16S rRNA (guanine(527)-N(7))-methyltransferase RsmG [Candidatus Acidoferrales bacterium]
MAKRELHSPPDQALVRATLARYGFAPTHAQIELIQSYIQLLLLWNRKINLTSLVSHRDILERHFGESVFALCSVPIVSGRLADVGSGAGFPGLALKIARPGMNVVLVEANHKKAAFLSEVRRVLSLEGVEIVCARIEQLGAKRGFADFVSARAVGDFPKILLWSSQALPAHGKLLLWVGSDEAIRLSKTNGWLWGSPVTIPGSRRRVLLIGEPAPA